MRIRTRTAVTGGLAASGYEADQAGGLLKFFDLTRPGEIIPAEWFVASRVPRANPRAYSAVLVLWVPDSAVVEQPIRSLQRILAALPKEVRREGTDYRVVGPYWSGILIEMLRETRRKPDGGIKLQPSPTPLTFYSSTATTADAVLEQHVGLPAATDIAYLDQDADGETSQRDRPPIGRATLAPVPASGAAPEQSVRLLPLTCTDDQLANALLLELSLRRINPLAADSRILLFSDWDTQYGRALPLTFAAALKKFAQLNAGHSGRPHFDAEPPADLAAVRTLAHDEPSAWPPQLLRVYYLSGLDGGQGLVDYPEQDGPKGLAGEKARVFQRSSGEHQVDYIRRLSGSIDDRLNEQNIPGRPKGIVRAIGVLGADAHDRLLLLQALRPLFPDAVFFTIGYDARFLDPAHLRYTRNVVVATAFGPELFRTWQTGVPPFRDGDQTATFFATQMALQHRGVWVPGHLRREFRPLLFEIGRLGLVPLAMPGNPQGPDTKRDLLVEGEPVTDSPLHPKVARGDPRTAHDWGSTARKTATLCVSGVFMVILCVFVARGRLQVTSTGGTTRRAAALILLAGGVILGFLPLYDGMEPMNLWDGVSIWPSQAVRIVALLVAILFIQRAYRHVRERDLNLAESFGLPASEPTAGSVSQALDSASDVFLRPSQPEWEYLGPHDAGRLRAHEQLREGKSYLEARAELTPPSTTPLPRRAALITSAPPAALTTGALETSISARALTPVVEDSRALESPTYVDIDLIWAHHLHQGRGHKRALRALFMTVCYLLAVLTLFGVVGFPTVPARGEQAWIIDRLLTYSSGLLMCYVMFWVVDATHCNRRILEKLSRHTVTWWSGLYREPARVYGLDPRHEAQNTALGHYFDVTFAGRMTDTTVRLIYAPFILLGLVLAARWSYFDRWALSPLVFLLYCATALICVFCAGLLRRKAASLKANALAAMEGAILSLRGSASATVVEQVKHLRDLAQRNQQGAFLPWSAQPVVRAVLIPLTSTGGLELLRVLNQAS